MSLQRFVLVVGFESSGYRLLLEAWAICEEQQQPEVQAAITREKRYPQKSTRLKMEMSIKKSHKDFHLHTGCCKGLISFNISFLRTICTSDRPNRSNTGEAEEEHEKQSKQFNKDKEDQLNNKNHYVTHIGCGRIFLHTRYHVVGGNKERESRLLVLSDKEGNILDCSLNHGRLWNCVGPSNWTGDIVLSSSYEKPVSSEGRIKKDFELSNLPWSKGFQTSLRRSPTSIS